MVAGQQRLPSPDPFLERSDRGPGAPAWQVMWTPEDSRYLRMQKTLAVDTSANVHLCRVMDPAALVVIHRHQG